MQQQLTEILQEQMRDVHLPTDIGWWPLAPGWWIIIVLLLFAGIATTYLVFKNKRRQAYRQFALKELNHNYTLCQETGSTRAYLQSANAILKRCVLHASGTSDAARLSGKAWLNTLSAMIPGDLSDQVETALGILIYQAESDLDVKLIHSELQDWVRFHQVDSINGLKAPAGTRVSPKSQTGQIFAGGRDA